MILYLMAIVLIALIAGNVRAENWQPQALELEGRYKLPNELTIEITYENNRFVGTIIELGNFNGGQTNDVKNPDKTKQEQPLKGKVIIRNLKYDSKEEKWVDGEMYAPKKGIWVDLEIETIHEDYLVAKGSKFLFSKKVVWERIPFNSGKSR